MAREFATSHQSIIEDDESQDGMEQVLPLPRNYYIDYSRHCIEVVGLAHVTMQNEG